MCPRCAGCFKVVDLGSPDAATDEYRMPWHTRCFRAFHPDSLLLPAEPTEGVPASGPTSSPRLSSALSTLVPSPQAAAAASFKRRKSWRIPTEAGQAPAALLTEDVLSSVPPTIPEATHAGERPSARRPACPQCHCVFL